MPASDRRRPARVWDGEPWAAALLCFALNAAAPSAQADPPAGAGSSAVSVARGAALFEGREALVGRIREHATPMPSAVVTCQGCHASAGPAGSGGSAPHLDAAWLRTPRNRRNSPPSSYTLATFCKAIRTGVDPRYVMLSRVMPVFVASDDQYASLWLFLTTENKT